MPMRSHKRIVPVAFLVSQDPIVSTENVLYVQVTPVKDQDQCVLVMVDALTSRGPTTIENVAAIIHFKAVAFETCAKPLQRCLL